MTDSMTRPAPNPLPVLRRTMLLVALLFGALATAFSAAGSWIPSLWGDEVTSVMSAQRSLPSLMQMLGHVDAVHGAYYLGLRAWGSFFGFSPFAVRFPSALAVGAMTVAVVLLAERLRTRRVAVIAGLVCLILPRVTYMGEEARSYAFSAAIAAWLTLMLVIALGGRRVRPGWWVGYGLLLAIGVYLFLYVALFVAVHALIVSSARPSRRFVVAWTISVVSAAVVASPLALIAVGERAQIAYLGTTQQLGFQTLFSGLWFGTWAFAIPAWGLIGVAVVAEVGRRLRDARAEGAARYFRPGPRRPALVSTALAWLLAPTVLLIAAHPFVPDFTARYVSFCAPAAAILIACGIEELLGFRRWIGVVAAAVAIALVIPVYFSQRTPYAKNQSDWAQISEVVGTLARPGDAIVFDESTRPSRRPRLAMHAYPAGFAGLKDVTLQTSYTRAPSWHDTTYSVEEAADRGNFARVNRVWLIAYAPSPGKADVYGVRDLKSLGFHATATQTATHRGLITLYERAS